MALAAVAAAGVMVAVAPASPAQAALPVCDGSYDFAGHKLYDWDILYPAYYRMPSYYYRNYGEYTFSCTLRYGNSGAAVRALQTSLNECMRFYTGVSLIVDGSFGPDTLQALTAAQRVFGIPADGVYGPQTAQTIQHQTYLTHGGYWSCETWRP